MLRSPRGVQVIACSRETDPGVLPFVGSRGRIPAQARQTSFDVSRALGKNALTESIKYFTSSAVARTSSGGADVNVSVVPTMLIESAGRTKNTRPSIGDRSVIA